MKGRVPKTELGGILVQAKCAAKNIRAQRDRLLRFQLQLQLQTMEGDANAREEVVSGLFRVYCEGLEAGARYLTACLAMTARSGEPPSLPLDFAVISDEQLFARLLALRLPRRPVTQAQAFARLEAAFYAVTLNLRYCLTRCIGHLGHPKCADDDDEDGDVGEFLEYFGFPSLPDTTEASSQSQGRREIGLLESDNAEIGLPVPVAAATEDLTKISLSAPDAAATDPTQDSSKIGPASPDDAATDGTPQAAIVDMDQARDYLERACTLADLAVKHVDLAVTAISSCLDSAQVASISDFADSFAYTK